MKPIEISALIYYYTMDLGNPIGANDANLNRLVDCGLLSDKTNPFTITDRGKAYVESLTNVPLPVCRWVTPDV